MVVDDLLGSLVAQPFTQPPSGLDAQLAVLRRDHQKSAVVVVAMTDAPGVEQPQA